MAKPSLTELVIGGFAYFVESGKTVDSQTVSSTVKPDTDPATNWTDSTLGTILNFKLGTESIDASYLAPLASGGYGKINRKLVTQDFITLKTREMGELVHRLQMGLTAEIAKGTAQTPGLATERKVLGWLRIQGRQLDGTDRFIVDGWCEATLEETGEFNDKVVEPVLRFTFVKGVAGNSINFPA